MTKIKTKKTYGKIDIRKNVRKFQYNTFLRLKVRYERVCPSVTHKLTHIFTKIFIQCKILQPMGFLLKKFSGNL